MSSISPELQFSEKHTEFIPYCIYCLKIKSITNTISTLQTKLNTKHDVVHDAIHSVSLQGEGVPGLQSLVDSPPTSGRHLANGAIAVAVILKVGPMKCLQQLGSILVNGEIGPFTGVVAALITECYQVDSSTGGGEHS